MEQTQHIPYPKGMIHHVRPNARWEHLAQSPATVDELKQACDRFTLGENVTYLLTGPNGDEKLLAAKIIASTLNQDMYQVDLSTVVSRYDGETVKSLHLMIKEAEDSGSVLFFDEFNGLLTESSEVKDPNDHFTDFEANSIISHIKEYKGLVILATNGDTDPEKEFPVNIHYLINFS